MPSKRYYQEHKEEIRLKSKIRYYKNREQILKKAKKYFCIELGCNEKVQQKNTRCRKHAEKYKVYPSRKGKNNNAFIDGRSLKTYYCIDCGVKISTNSGIYGSGLCRSCSAKRRLINSKNHPMFGCERKDLQIKFKGEGNPRFGKHHTIEQKMKWSKMRKGTRNGMFGKHHSEETKELIRQKIVIRIKDGKYNIKPNKPEKLLNKLLNKMSYKEYKYVGNFKFWIDCYNPDFINVNGQKKIIELYGTYWHNREDAKKRDKRRIRTYNRYGYKTLIIWEHELKDLNKLEPKIKNFNKSKLK